METKEIHKLLVEASKPETSGRRLNEIQCVLESEVFESKVINDRSAGILLVLCSLYVSTLENDPKLLPSLLPVFSMICGDRDDKCIIADIDWSFINKNN